MRVEGLEQAREGRDAGEELKEGVLGRWESFVMLLREECVSMHAAPTALEGLGCLLGCLGGVTGMAKRLCQCYKLDQRSWSNSKELGVPGPWAVYLCQST